MEFRSWYETVKRPEDEHPAGKDPRINDAAVNQVVSKMADNTLNSKGLVILITGKSEQYQDLRADGPIAGQLLDLQNPKLQKLDARVPLLMAPEEFSFKFVIGGKNAGNLYLWHPPLLYDNTDKALMSGIMYHELQHAIDWVRGMEFDIKNPRRVNARLYASSIHEARAFTRQLKHLLTAFGNPQDVMAAISRKVKNIDIPGIGQKEVSSPFRWESEELREFALEFLHSVVGLNEDVAPMIGKALLGASSFMPQQVPQMHNVQHHIAASQNSNMVAVHALEQIQAIGKKFFLKNFLN
jgi:hypothetical protein